MPNFNETQINPSDVKAVFRDADKLKNTGFKGMFKGLRKNKVELSDLQNSWKDAGYPDDTRDISAILKNHGFSDKEINKVYSKVFGSDKDNGEKYTEPTQSAAIRKIAKYAKEHGLADEIKTFLAQEYGFKESVNSYGKALVEDIREIFINILDENREDRSTLIKQYEQTHLGRTKK